MNWDRDIDKSVQKYAYRKFLMLVASQLVFKRVVVGDMYSSRRLRKMAYLSLWAVPAPRVG